MPGCKHGKLCRTCKKRADDLLKLHKHQLRLIAAIPTGHAPVRGHLQTIGRPVWRRSILHILWTVETETVQHLVRCCEVLSRQRCNVYGELTVELNVIRTATDKDQCLFISHTGLYLNCAELGFWGCTISLRLQCFRCVSWRALRWRRRRRRLCVFHIVTIIDCEHFP